MSTGTMIAAALGALVIATGVGAVIAGSDDERELTMLAGEEDSKPSSVAEAAPAKKDCRVVATNETGFDPATTPFPVREDAGNKQVLKGTAVGAAVGAVAGEVIGGKPGLGAAAGAGAGAAGGQAIKADKQNDADRRYDADLAAYEQQKAAYDAALQNCLG